MVKSFYISITFIFAFGLFSLSASAQVIEAQTSDGRPQPVEQLPQNIQETLKKQEIEQLRKEHEEMLENGELAVKLTEEVEESYNKSENLTSQDIEKLAKIEKLFKKIRKELGGDGDESEVEFKKPRTIKNAISDLKETAVNLFGELKKTSRYSISAVAIQSSNTLIDIVRYIRFWKK